MNTHPHGRPQSVPIALTAETLQSQALMDYGDEDVMVQMILRTFGGNVNWNQIERLGQEMREAEARQRQEQLERIEQEIEALKQRRWGLINHHETQTALGGVL